MKICPESGDRQVHVPCAMDGETGVSRFHYVIGCSIFHNSFYAATEIGPHGARYYGTFCGINKLQP